MQRKSNKLVCPLMMSLALAIFWVWNKCGSVSQAPLLQAPKWAQLSNNFLFETYTYFSLALLVHSVWNHDQCRPSREESSPLEPFFAYNRCLQPLERTLCRFHFPCTWMQKKILYNDRKLCCLQISSFKGQAGKRATYQTIRSASMTMPCTDDMTMPCLTITIPFSNLSAQDVGVRNQVHRVQGKLLAFYLGSGRAGGS